MNTSVLGAVLRRNFVSYFSGLTGYVFICAFVLLGGIAAFWPAEFFNANLANLAQLSLWFPSIMLIFIPAITMAIWADERRQGTDELLLTIPGGDFEIVLGKYLATVGVYTVSLIFSLVCNLVVMEFLGQPDIGLYLGTYFGYWFIGLAMLAIGMVASFVTSNLTAAYILGLIFNLPLVYLSKIDNIINPASALGIKRWGISERFYDFGQGVISLSGVVYFLMIVAVMLYLSVLLISRRHWLGMRNGASMGGHYAVRVLSLVALAVGLNLLFQDHDARLDVTSEQLSSLSPDTVKLLSNLQPKRPVLVEAFVSPSVPESYVQTRLNLLAMLNELKARGVGKIQVSINSTERFSEEAALAEQRFGITPRRVPTLDRGAMGEAHLFLGVAFTCGLEKVIVPFIDRGIPVEYELVRSLCTVTQQKRKKVGILQTDAQLHGQFNMQTMQSGQNWPIIDELEKQYEVVQVDPANPITDKYDVLLAVQPSSLGPEQMDHFVAAVESGQATAIFEDPCPVFTGDVPATSARRQPPGGNNPMMMMMGGGRQQEQPKGDVGRLWRALGVDFTADQVVWQRYNPYRKASQFPAEFVFVDQGEGSKDPFGAKDKISSGLQHMLFPFPGAITRLQASNLEFTPLVVTGDKTGIVQYNDVLNMSPFGPRGLNEQRQQIPTNSSYVLAAHIHGKVRAPQQMADDAKAAAPPKPADKKPAEKAEKKAAVKPAETKPADSKTAESKPAENKPADAKAAKPAEAKTDQSAAKPAQPKVAEAKPAEPARPKEVELNVVVVADIDMLSRDFFRLREQGDMPEAGIHFEFDNVAFVLNTLDMLAGDDRFVEMRKRRPKYRTLTKVEETTEAARDETSRKREQFIDEFKKGVEREKKMLNDKVEDLKKRKNANQLEVIQELGIIQETGQQRLDAATERLQRERDKAINDIETKLAIQIRKVQDSYKFWAVALPWILPLGVGLVVFFNRRAREREGVAKSRLRSGSPEPREPQLTKS